MNHKQIKALQTALKIFGFYDGLIDGDAGPKTRVGIGKLLPELSAILLNKLAKQPKENRPREEKKPTIWKGRSIKRAFVHCSATPPNLDIGVKEIRRWHRRNGWSDVGYHDVIRRDGSTEKGRPIKRMGAHAKGHNRDSIGVCLVGGVDKKNRPEDNFTDAQYRALKKYRKRRDRELGPLTWHGHYEVSAKACPCFNVAEFFSRNES